MIDQTKHESASCDSCGNIYDEMIADGCPVCGYGKVERGEIARDGTYGGHKEQVRELVDELGPIRMCDLYDVYERESENPRAVRTVRRYLRELHVEGDIDALGEKKGRRYV